MTSTMRFLALLALTVFAAGCSRTPVVPDAPAGPVGYPSHSSAQIVQAVRASIAPVRSVSAAGRVSVKTDRLDQDATFILAARMEGRRTDSVTVSVRGPLGIEGGRGVVTADSVLAADKINRVLYVGLASAAERYVPGGGSPAAAARVLLGLLVPEANVAWQVRPVGGTYTLTGSIGNGIRRVYTVDPAMWRVTAVREYDRSGALRAQQDVSEFEVVGRVMMPRRVHVASQGSEVTFEHRRLEINPSELRLTFSRPGYRVVRLR